MAWKAVALPMLGLALLLATAKAHGRQVRLRRETEGHLHADFRCGNDPWVEALWRRDRRGYWAVAALAGTVSALHVWATGAEHGMPVWLHALVALAISLSAAFEAMAAWWALDMARSGRAAPAGAWAGTFAWGGLSAAIGLAMAWTVGFAP